MSEQATTNERMATILALDPSARLAFSTETSAWYVESVARLSGYASDAQPSCVHYASASLAVTIFLHRLQHPGDGAGRVFVDDGRVRRFWRWDDEASRWESVGERPSTRPNGTSGSQGVPASVWLVGSTSGDDAVGGINVDGVLTDPDAAARLAESVHGSGIYEVPLNTPGRLFYEDHGFAAGTWEWSADGSREFVTGTVS